MEGDDIRMEINGDHGCDLYAAAETGSPDAFSRILNQVSAAEHKSSDDILHWLHNAGNTFLHRAAKFGNEDIVTYIGEKDPSLLLHKNSDGETALHLAAKRGHVSVVKALVAIHKLAVEFHRLAHVLGSSEAEETNDINLLRARNKKENTALHEALINGQESIAEYLIQEDPEVSCYENYDGESVLYLAAKIGSVKCVAVILRSSTVREWIIKQVKSPFEAAIIGKHAGVLYAMLNVNPSLRDGLGRTPLHHAASLGYLKEVHYLLSNYPSSASQRDWSDSLPIHLASINGHVDIIKILLKDFPYAAELLNEDGQNILHLAASYGRYNVVRYILNNSQLTNLVNMKDDCGDTPLHLAASRWHLNIVFDFTWHNSVDVKLVNKKGSTALDCAEMCGCGQDPTFHQHLTCAALKAAGVPRSVSGNAGRDSYKRHNHAMEKYKERINTLLLMSTLVATITFAAGFTLPGGYNSSSNTDLGIATMLREKGFDVFIFCDTVAMHCSIIVAVTLIWAQLGDTPLVLNVLALTAPLLGVALGMMSMAFTAGVFLAVSKLRWLSIAVLVMGITFIAILSVLLFPLCVPLDSSKRILRYISYYPFYLVILASSSWPKNQPQERPPPARTFIQCSTRRRRWRWRWQL